MRKEIEFNINDDDENRQRKFNEMHKERLKFLRWYSLTWELSLNDFLSDYVFIQMGSYVVPINEVFHFIDSLDDADLKVRKPSSLIEEHEKICEMYKLTLDDARNFFAPCIEQFELWLSHKDRLCFHDIKYCATLLFDSEFTGLSDWRKKHGIEIPVLHEGW